MIKRIISMALMLAFSMSMFLLVGCKKEGNKYNVKIMASGYHIQIQEETGIIFKEEFLANNVTYGAQYYVKVVNPETGEIEEKLFEDEALPETRTHIIRDKALWMKRLMNFQKLILKKR